jgi:hypothetical protein
MVDPPVQQQQAAAGLLVSNVVTDLDFLVAAELVVE